MVIQFKRKDEEIVLLKSIIENRLKSLSNKNTETINSATENSNNILNKPILLDAMHSASG